MLKHISVLYSVSPGFGLFSLGFFAKSISNFINRNHASETDYLPYSVKSAHCILWATNLLQYLPFISYTKAILIATTIHSYE